MHTPCNDCESYTHASATGLERAKIAIAIGLAYFATIGKNLAWRIVGFSESGDAARDPMM